MKTSITFTLFLLSWHASLASAQPLPIQDLGILPGDTAIAPATNSQQDLAIAAGGTQFLAAWSDYRGRSAGNQTIQSDGDIFGIRLDSAGNAIDPMPFLIAGGMGLQNRPKIAWNGENWLVLYESQDPSGGYYDTFIRAVRVSAQGQTLDETPLAFPPDLFSPSTIGLTVAGQGGQWLVARCVYHTDGYGTFLAGQRIASDGTLLDLAPIMLNDWVYGPLKIIVASGEYTVVGPEWNDSSILKARRIATNLQPLAPSFNLPYGALSIAGNGSNYYVTWLSGFVNLVGSRMTATGALLDPAGTMLVPNVAGSMSLEYDGTNWWFARSVSNLAWTMRINAAGVVLDPGGVQLPINVSGSVNSLYDTQIVPRSAGGVLFGWTDYRAALGSVSNSFALPVSPANVAGAEHCLTTGTRNQRNTAISSGPDNTLAVAFISEAANDDRVLVQFLSAAMTPLTPSPIEVVQAPAIGSCGIAWNGSIFMITWDGGSGGTNTGKVMARRMNSDGTFLDAPTPVMNGMVPAIEALGDDFLIACSRFATYPQFIDLWVNRIDGPTGASMDGPNGVVLSGGYVNGLPRVRTDGTQWLVAAHSMWTHDSSQGDAILAKVPPVGAPALAFNPTPISGGTGDLDIAFSGSKYLLVWRMNSLSNANNYIAGRIMNADGTFPPGYFIIAEATGRQLRPTVAWDGTTFIVAWDDQRNQAAFFDARTDIYGARVTESGSVLDPAGFPIVIGPQVAAMAILSRPNGITYGASTRFVNSSLHDSYRINLTQIGGTALPGDINGDGLIDSADLSIFVSVLLGNSVNPAHITASDLNHDGLTNGDDVNRFIAAFVS
ncbi:MAG: hypothetical protein HZA51_15990 [Planctomycetes bacterium]|nr:hypothetical protein [Planctomycetota bacterium]